MAFSTPLFEVLQHQLDFACHESDVGDETFDVRFAEVGLQSREKVVFVLFDHLDHLLKLLLAPGQWASMARVVGIAESGCVIGHEDEPTAALGFDDIEAVREGIEIAKDCQQGCGVAVDNDGTFADLINKSCLLNDY